MKLQQAQAEDDDKRAKLLQEFLENMAKIDADYHKEDLRATEDYLIERRRAVEDSNRALQDYASERDVAGFLKEQRDSRIKLQRMDEDFALAEVRRAQDWSQRQQEENARYAKELANLKEAYAKQLAQQQAALAQQIAQEAASLVKKNSLAAALEKQYADVRYRWQLADEAARASAEWQSYQRRRADLVAHLASVEASIQAFWSNLQAMGLGSAGGYGGLSGWALSNMQGGSYNPGANWGDYAPMSTANNINVGPVNMGELVTPSSMGAQLDALVAAIGTALGLVK